MKIKTAFLLVLISIWGFAQNIAFTAPNYKEIEKNINDKNSEFYYQNLLSKLKRNDTLITKEQYKHLYFGYIFQTDYNPYERGKNTDKLQKYYKGEFEKDEIPTVIKTFKQELENFPVDLRALNFLAYMYHMNGNEEMANKTSKNFHGIFDAILSSGDGKNCETAFHVISVSHEYVLLNMFELEMESQSFDGKCDFLAFEKDKYKVPGLYFNVEKLQAKNLQLLKSKF